jgi:hypothetical protein
MVTMKRDISSSRAVAQHGLQLCLVWCVIVNLLTIHDHNWQIGSSSGVATPCDFVARDAHERPRTKQLTASTAPRQHSADATMREPHIHPVDTVASVSRILPFQRSTTQPQPQPRIWLAVPGHGNPERLPLLKASLTALHQSAARAQPQPLDFGCVVYVWKSDLVENVTLELQDLCSVEYSRGLWTHHLLKVGQPPSANAIKNTSAAAGAAPTHIAIMMDDIDARSIDLPSLYQSMVRANFTVASPAVSHVNNPSHLARNRCMAHETGHVDILWTIFTAAMYDCYRHQIDLTTNENGWGYDISLADLCGARIGVIDHQSIYHEPPCSQTTANAPCEAVRTYDHSVAFGQMDEYVRAARNLSTMQEGREYKNYVAYYRPFAFPYCKLVSYQWMNRKHNSNHPHQGAWASVLQGLDAMGYVSLEAPPAARSPQKQVRRIALLDGIEHWFDTPNSVVREPWVGFVHEEPMEISDRFGAALDATLELRAFRKSARHCLALFVFTTSSAARVNAKLHSLNVGNVQVCVVSHPIVEAAIVSAVNQSPGLLFNTKVEYLGQQMIDCTTAAMSHWKQPSKTLLRLQRGAKTFATRSRYSRNTRHQK